MIQVSGDVPTLPSLRPNPNPKPAPTQTIGLRERREGMSHKTRIDPHVLPILPICNVCGDTRLTELHHNNS